MFIFPLKKLLKARRSRGMEWSGQLFKYLGVVTGDVVTDQETESTLPSEVSMNESFLLLPLV
jgi:hypothetical protein